MTRQPFFDAHCGIVGVDIETASGVELREAGAWAYSRHPSTIVHVLSWCYAEGPKLGPVHQWHPHDRLPDALLDYLRVGGQLLAHNAGFEQAIWSNILVTEYDFPPVELAQWRDSQAVGLEINLPAKLEGLAKALGTPVEKDMEGNRLMRKMARAEAAGEGWNYPHVNPDNIQRLSQYCDDDVLAMMHAWFKMKPLPLLEERVRRLDQKINARGVYLDREHAGRLKRLARRRKTALADATFATTAGELDNSTSVPALKLWLKKQGVQLPKVTRKKADGTYTKSESASKTVLAEMLEEHDLDDIVRTVLENRVEANKATSLAKLERVEPMVGGDGRLRNALQFHAAGTGRWSSSGLQIHNLPKDRLSPEASALVDLLIEREDLAGLELVEARPLDVLSQKLRSVIAAAPGFDLIAADFSAIEARVLAWLAGQDDKLDFLSDYDTEMARYGTGLRPDKPRDLYEYAAGSIGSTARQLGKVCELALGYGMGDIRFASTSAAWGVPLSLLDARRTKQAWRETNPMIVRFWRDLEDAAKAVTMSRGRMIDVGRLKVYANAHCLFLLLPSGRKIRYWKPSVVTAMRTIQFVDDEGTIITKEYESAEIRYHSQNLAKSGMSSEGTYGGKLAENATQAVARDLLAEALLRLDAAGYPLVMHVHDSAAAEVRAGTELVHEFCAVMAEVPAWAEGCPVGVSGYRAQRFRG